MFSVSEIFDIAIRIEENGESYYRQALENTSEPALRALLRSIADDELAHRDWFLRIKKSEKVMDGNFFAEQISGALLQDVLDHHAFSLDEVDFGSIPDEKTLLEIALGFEEDSIAFYEIIGAFITDSAAIQRINEIIAEERKHVALIEERQETRGKRPEAGL